jgi:outer membrane biosynthesis protein TonB
MDKDWIDKFKNDENRFGALVTGGIHVLLIIIALLYTIDFNLDNRSAYIEVTLGEYRSGTIAERSEVRPEQVATRPNPSEIQPDRPAPEQPRPIETPQRVTEETTKPVDLTKQEEEVEAEVLRTPETEVVDPQNKQTAETVEEIVIPPKTSEDEKVQEGAENSGDVRGTQGDLNAEQGTGTDEDLSSPYNLQWEGDLERAPMIQPLPENVANTEAVITVRFEVNIDGSVGRIIPLRKMNPELESEVMRTLRSWRFSRLPAGAPQESQWGIITFRFVFD